MKQWLTCLIINKFWIIKEGMHNAEPNTYHKILANQLMSHCLICVYITVRLWGFCLALKIQTQDGNSIIFSPIYMLIVSPMKYVYHLGTTNKNIIGLISIELLCFYALGI